MFNLHQKSSPLASCISGLSSSIIFRQWRRRKFVQASQSRQHIIVANNAHYTGLCSGISSRTLAIEQQHQATYTLSNPGEHAGIAERYYWICADVKPLWQLFLLGIVSKWRTKKSIANFSPDNPPAASSLQQRPPPVAGSTGHADFIYWIATACRNLLFCKLTPLEA